jgi:hypothetical protein
VIRLAQATLDYCRFVLDVAARARQAGLSPLQAAQETGRQRTARPGVAVTSGRAGQYRHAAAR